MAMDGHHGNTWAAWAAVAVGLLGVLITCIALMMSPVSWLLFWVGLALLPIGLVLATVLSKAGLGTRH